MMVPVRNCIITPMLRNYIIREKLFYRQKSWYIYMSRDVVKNMGTGSYKFYGLKWKFQCFGYKKVDLMNI